MSAEGEEALFHVLGGDVTEMGLMLAGRSSRPPQKAS